MTALAPKLHASPWQGVFYVTGGGASLISQLLEVPGASNTVLEATVPYAEKSLAELLGKAPEQAVATATARAMAMAAFKRANALADGKIFGFGASASLVTTREKKGQTRAHWAIQASEFTHSFSLLLDAQQSRQEQEAQLTEAFWWSIGWALLDPSNAEADIATASSIEKQSHLAQKQWLPLLQASPHTWCTGDHDGKLLLPGSFNPVHQGHKDMLKVAESITGRRGAFELTLRNADKPDIDFLSTAERLEKITEHDVWLTNLSTFSEKAAAFPGATFALGTDTLARIGELRFYANDEKLREQGFRALADLEIKFLVFGRAADDNFIALENLELPPTLAQLCQGVPVEAYRNNISSSALRADARNKP
jgi:nicotinamide mononucleotide (NMN) deamidase PncC/nicotinic acid mononucleotide adenylyltransferase